MQTDVVIAGPSEDFRLTIKRISDDLDSDEVLTLKYLCVDYLPRKRFEEIDSGLELFDVLCNKNVVTAEDTKYLAECLFTIRRVDLLRDQLHLSVRDVQRMISENSRLNSFRVMVMHVVECMGSEEVKQLGFILDRFLPKKYTKYKSGYTILLALERSGNLSPDDLDLLERVIEKVAEDGDAVAAVRNYKAQRQTHRPREAENEVTPGPRESGEPAAVGSFGTGVAANEKQRELHQMRGQRAVDVPQKHGQWGIHAPPKHGQWGIHAPSNTGSAEAGACGSQSLPPLSGLSDRKEMSGSYSEESSPSVIFPSDMKSLPPSHPMEGYSLVPSSKPPVTSEGELSATGGCYENVTSKQLEESNISYRPGAAGQNEVPYEKPHLFRPPGESWQPKGNETNDKQLPSILDELEIEPNPAGSGEPQNAQNQSSNIPLTISSMESEDEGEPSDDDHPAPTEAADEEVNHEQPMEEEVTVEDNLPINILNRQGTAHTQDNVQRINVEAMERELEQLRQEIYTRDHDMPSYKINSDPRGVCIIINNVKFKPVRGGKPLKDRHGSDVDQENLRYIFSKLKFVVEVYRDMTRERIMQVVKRAAYQTDHTNYDCFAFCILSHGARGEVYGVDGLSVEISTITHHFRGLNCETLRKKPKLFFIQACQGNINQVGFETDTDNNYGETPALLPNESDFLVGYATLPGYVSYRSETHGSWYISMLVEMLDKYSDRHDLLSIMIKVNEEVAKASALIEGGIYKQSPVPQPTLRKKVFLKK